MKLIDILVLELPKRGGWPSSLEDAFMLRIPDITWTFRFDSRPAAILHGEVVTHAEYEATLAAPKVPVWDGKGLPPIGCEVDIYHNPNYTVRDGCAPTGTIVKVVAHETTTDGNDVAVVFWCEDGGGRSECLVSWCLRPIRTEAERKREEAGIAIYHAINWNAEGELASPLRMEDYRKAYDAIAAGKIPGIRLTDDAGSQ